MSNDTAIPAFDNPSTVKRQRRVQQSTLNKWVGKRFGLLVITSLHEARPTTLVWNCICDCGNETVVWHSNLMSGATSSCGCKMREHQATGEIKHGKSKSRVYNIWQGMLQRCSNPNCHAWKDYGGRGITVCDEWQTFEVFYADMGNPPNRTTLDRIDNNGNYTPNNCRWATLLQQARNRRNTTWITHAGRTQPLTAWANEYSICTQVLQGRLKSGWDLEKALNEPVRKKLSPTPPAYAAVPTEARS